MDFGLQNKVALVTGGSKGIGKAIARELAREGADVVISARTLSDLESAAQELEAETGRRVLPMQMDVTQRDQVDRVTAEVAQQLGGLHILVNSGSYPGGSPGATGPIDTLVDEALLTDFDVKYVGALRCCPRRHSIVERAGVGPDYQYQRRQCPQRRQLEWWRAQCFAGAYDQNVVQTSWAAWASQSTAFTPAPRERNARLAY